MSNWFDNVFRDRAKRDTDAHAGAAVAPLAELGDFPAELRDQLVGDPSTETQSAHMQLMTEATRLDPVSPAVMPPSNDAPAGAAGEEADMGFLRNRGARIVLVTLVLVVGTTGMAFAGALPDSVKQAANDAANAVGIDLPGADDAADEAAEDAADAADEAADEAVDDAAEAAEAAAQAADEAAGAADDDADELVGEQESEDADDQGQDGDDQGQDGDSQGEDGDSQGEDESDATDTGPESADSDESESDSGESSDSGSKTETTGVDD